jgi:sensor histidine kinase YesM
MLMQPIVENAIKHGVSKREDDGYIEIRTRRLDGRLLIDVRDNGPGLAEREGDEATAERGHGLANTRARLGNLFDSGYSFELGNAPDGGTVVRLELPFADTYEEREAPH